jgi:hypothetical protein
MGQPDLYPFDPSPNVIAKVRFIHELLHPGASRTDPSAVDPDPFAPASRIETEDLPR